MSLTCAWTRHYFENKQSNSRSLFTLSRNTGMAVAWILRLLTWKQEPDARAAASKFYNKFLPCGCVDFGLRNTGPDDFETACNSHFVDFVVVACCKHDVSHEVSAANERASESRSSENHVVKNTGTLFTAITSTASISRCYFQLANGVTLSS